MLYIIFLSQLLLKWHGVVVFGLTLDRGKKKKNPILTISVIITNSLHPKIKIMF
jgi:hypothetical protein